MAQIRKLAPHDPLPEGGRHVVLLRRFEEDDPRRIVLETIVSLGPGRAEARLAVHADGTPMSVAEALQAARVRAEQDHLDPIYIIDRLAGPREREILRAHGDHSVHMGQLDDFDLEEGERGSDLRDRRG